MSEKDIRFDVPGIPQPGGSKTPYRNKYTKKTHVVDANPKAKDWKALVAMYAAEAMRGRELITGAVSLRITFYRTRPKSHYRGKSHLVKSNAPQYPTTRPDATKLLRSTEDALTGIVWVDDPQVCVQHVYKEYGKPGATIVVHELEAGDE